MPDDVRQHVQTAAVRHAHGDVFDTEVAGAPDHPAEGVVRKDMARGELALIAPLLALMFVLGLYPYLVVHALPALGQGMQVLHW